MGRLNEAGEMMLILGLAAWAPAAQFAFFLPHPYPQWFWGPQSSLLPPKATGCASCLTLSKAGCSITLPPPSPGTA